MEHQRSQTRRAGVKPHNGAVQPINRIFWVHLTPDSGAIVGPFSMVTRALVAFEDGEEPRSLCRFNRFYMNGRS